MFKIEDIEEIIVSHCYIGDISNNIIVLAFILVLVDVCLNHAIP